MPQDQLYFKLVFNNSQVQLNPLLEKYFKKQGISQRNKQEAKGNAYLDTTTTMLRYQDGLVKMMCSTELLPGISLCPKAKKKIHYRYMLVSLDQRTFLYIFVPNESSNRIS